MKKIQVPKELNLNEQNILELITKQYQNQGLSLLELLEVGNRGLEKANKRTQGLKNKEKKISQTALFIREEILKEINS